MTKGDTRRVQHGYRFTLTISEPFNLKRQSKRINDIELTLSILKYPCSHAIVCEHGSPFLWYRSSYFQGGGTTPPSISEAQEAGSENRFHVVSVKSSQFETSQFSRAFFWSVLLSKTQKLFFQRAQLNTFIQSFTMFHHKSKSTRTRN